MEIDPTDLEAEQASKEAANVEQAKRRAQEVVDFRWVMGDSRGRRFVWRLMREGRVFHDCSADDAVSMARFLGERRQGLRLMNEVIETCPEQWVNIIKEQKTT